jgi:hypothetical protein
LAPEEYTLPVQGFARSTYWALGAIIFNLSVRTAIGSRRLLPTSHPGRVYLEGREEKLLTMSGAMRAPLAHRYIQIGRALLMIVVGLWLYDICFGDSIASLLGFDADPITHRLYHPYKKLYLESHPVP